MNRFLRLFLALLLLAPPAAAQPYYFRHYQVENGLSNSSVFCSMQDGMGFMWFGTKDGLNRFDGYRFRTFHLPSEDETSLIRDLIFSLRVDGEGTLWVGAQKGLFRYDAARERFEPFLSPLKDINDLYSDPSGRLWFTSGSTLHCYRPKEHRLTVYPTDRFFRATAIWGDGADGLWCGTLDGYLVRLGGAGKVVHRYDLFAHSARPGSRYIEKIAGDGKGTLYIGTASQGIKVFHPATGTYRDLLTHNPDKTTVYVRDILPVSNREIWFATESGLFILDPSTGRLVNLKKKYLDPYSLSDNALYTLYQDREGGIWAGTYFDGLNYFPKQATSFQKYFPDYSKNSISGSAVREICQDGSGDLWIGTEDAGLNRLHPPTGTITRFEPTGAPSSIAYSNIHGLLVRGSELWIGTFQHGLDVMDIRTGKVIRHYSSGPGPYDLKSNFVVSLLQTRTGSLYIGTNNGLQQYDPAGDRFLPVGKVATGDFVSCLMEDSDGQVWVGTHNAGIYSFHPVRGTAVHYTNEAYNKNSLTTNTINALHEDAQGNLWVATEGGGLCQLTPGRNRFIRHTVKTGLPSNFVFKVLEDAKGELWITTSKGLARMTGDGRIATVYTKANGLLNDQFNYNSGYKDRDGRMYFGSVRGLITFQPEAFLPTRFVPPIHLTGFQVHNQETQVGHASGPLSRSILYTQRITLPHDQSSFSIDFAAIAFTAPEMTEYRYIMEGLDKDWTYIKEDRKVYFTNLGPGTYTFKVKAGNNGSWNAGVRQLTIRVLPPFWARPWAYALYLLVGASALYYGIRTYHRLQEDRKQKEIHEAKIEFFTNIAHEIKTPLTLIKGPVENLSEMMHAVPGIREDVVTMERNTNRLINLINQILDFRQIEAKGFSLDFSPVNLPDILQEAFDTFAPLAKKRRLSYTLDLPGGNLYMMADAEALNKVFTNLISNVVKYGEQKVLVRLLPLRREEEKVVVEVLSDGYPIPREMSEKIFEPFFRLKETVKQKGTGIGLALARSLVGLHNGSLYLRNPGALPNVFVVELPGAAPDKRKSLSETGQLAKS